ncbi:hypothetical protein Q5752_003534 [Cryptotrichosporon argae]
MSSTGSQTLTDLLTNAGVPTELHTKADMSKFLTWLTDGREWKKSVAAFDFDGVLVNTYPEIAKRRNELDIEPKLEQPCTDDDIPDTSFRNERIWPSKPQFYHVLDRDIYTAGWLVDLPTMLGVKSALLLISVMATPVGITARSQNIGWETLAWAAKNVPDIEMIALVGGIVYIGKVKNYGKTDFLNGIKVVGGDLGGCRTRALKLCATSDYVRSKLPPFDQAVIDVDENRIPAATFYDDSVPMIKQALAKCPDTLPMLFSDCPRNSWKHHTPDPAKPSKHDLTAAVDSTRVLGMRDVVGIEFALWLENNMGVLRKGPLSTDKLISQLSLTIHDKGDNGEFYLVPSFDEVMANKAWSKIAQVRAARDASRT